MARAASTTSQRVRWVATFWCTTATAVSVLTRVSLRLTSRPASGRALIPLFGVLRFDSVPIDTTTITTLYVFVDIAIDVQHLIRTVQLNFPKPETSLVLAGTIQFATAMQIARTALTPHYKQLFIPQAKPLSRTLRCVLLSPSRLPSVHDVWVQPAKCWVARPLSSALLMQSCACLPTLDPPIHRYHLPTTDVLCACVRCSFVADGRFHLESIMIHNPHIPAFYRYDPYNKQITLESYAHNEMHTIRK
jgi:2-(3-amino-3-carboxypropyl)histidine synthase